MHTAQKYAILAIIGMIKQGLAQLEGLLMLPSSDAATSGAPPPPPETPGGYISREEEDRLDAELEAARLHNVSQYEKRMATLLDDSEGLT